MNYTQAELTEKKYTVRNALKNASMLYQGGICTNAAHEVGLDSLLTLKELNDLVERLVEDSCYGY